MKFDTWKPNIFGLQNPKNFCYMNSCIQMLFGIPEFMGHIDKVTQGKKDRKKTILGAFIQVSKDIRDLNNGESYNPGHLQKVIMKKFQT
jgi:ubiquitin C-terminal hydrolase